MHFLADSETAKVALTTKTIDSAHTAAAAAATTTSATTKTTTAGSDTNLFSLINATIL